MIDFVGQFVISSSSKSIPDGFVVINCLDYYIGYHKSLHLTNLIGKDSVTLGFFIGLVVDYDSCKICEHEIFSKLSVDEFEKETDKIISSFGGSFIFISQSRNFKRIYLDTNGSLSLVYDKISKTIASTAGLLMTGDEYQERFDHKLYEHLEVEKHGWFPAGLTAHKGVERLLCNHYLDFDQWKQIRFWPKKEIVYTDDPKETAKQIGDIIKKTIVALVESNRKISLSITAGNETRILLACSKNLLDRITTFSVAGKGSELDAFMGRKLSKFAGVIHHNLSIIYADKKEQEMWSFLSGHCVGGSNMLTHKTLCNLHDTDLVLIGLGGEIARSFFWKKSDKSDQSIDAHRITCRFGMPYHKTVEEKVKEWLDNVPVTNKFTILDLAYMELRMCPWAFAQSYAENRFIFHFSPMVNTEIYRLMFTLPPEYKRNNNFVLDIIRNEWPELLDFPINKYDDFRDYVQIGRKLLDFTRVKKKIRKILSS